MDKILVVLVLIGIYYVVNYGLKVVDTLNTCGALEFCR